MAGEPRTDSERLRERVIRAQNAVGAPLRGALTGGEIVEIKPDMPDAEYEALVARNGMQTWTEADEEWLRETVARVRR